MNAVLSTALKILLAEIGIYFTINYAKLTPYMSHSDLQIRTYKSFSVTLLYKLATVPFQEQRNN